MHTFIAKYEVKNGVGIIPEGTVKVVSGAFRNCTELTKVIIPDSVTEIGSGAFSGCTNLTDISIPNCVTEIPFGTFMDCTGLTNIVIPDSVTSINSEAFRDCTGLTSIVIPKSVQMMGSHVFFGCTSLTSAQILCPCKLGDRIFYDSPMKTLTLGVGIKAFGEDFFYTREGVNYYGDWGGGLETIYVPAKKTDYYMKRIPKRLHDKIVELPAEKKK